MYVDDIKSADELIVYPFNEPSIGTPTIPLSPPFLVDKNYISNVFIFLSFTHKFVVYNNIRCKLANSAILKVSSPSFYKWNLLFKIYKIVN